MGRLAVFCSSHCRDLASRRRKTLRVALRRLDEAEVEASAKERVAIASLRSRVLWELDAFPSSGTAVK